jgi:hypothetical protein
MEKPLQEGRKSVHEYQFCGFAVFRFRAFLTGMGLTIFPQSSLLRISNWIARQQNLMYY